MIKAEPYLLINKIQNYSWGTKNSEAFIPNLLGIKAEQDLPYAELWIGTHPKAPSSILIEEKEYSLPEIIERFPKEILGEEIAIQFENKLPFLFKVLSANQALSIQAHPNKSLAEKLHKKDALNYPDDNHKPEIAISVDELIAIAGFKGSRELAEVFQEYLPLQKLVANQIVDAINSGADFSKKELYAQIMKAPDELIKNTINDLIEFIQSKNNKTLTDETFLVQFENYKYDVGLISILLFNIYKLKKDEAFFTGAGIPHCYIKGNIIECMANSDNVVRAGLTPKFKDTETLLEMVDTETKPEPIIPNSKNYIYKTAAKEFELEILTESKKFVDNTKLQILFVINGNALIKFHNKEMKISKGQSVLIPAMLTSVVIDLEENSKLFLATVPNK